MWLQRCQRKTYTVSVRRSATATLFLMQRNSAGDTTRCHSAAQNALFSMMPSDKLNFSTPVTVVPASSVRFNSRWYLCARKSPYALHPSLRLSFPSAAFKTVPLSLCVWGISTGSEILLCRRDLVFLGSRERGLVGFYAAIIYDRRQTPFNTVQSIVAATPLISHPSLSQTGHRQCERGITCQMVGYLFVGQCAKRTRGGTHTHTT